MNISNSLILSNMEHKDAAVNRDHFSDAVTGVKSSRLSYSGPPGVKVRELLHPDSGLSWSDICSLLWPTCPPKCCYFVVVGGLACLWDPRGYASWSFWLLVGTTMLDRLWARGQTKCNTLLMLATSVYGRIHRRPCYVMAQPKSRLNIPWPNDAECMGHVWYHFSCWYPLLFDVESLAGCVGG